MVKPEDPRRKRGKLFNALAKTGRNICLLDGCVDLIAGVREGEIIGGSPGGDGLGPMVLLLATAVMSSELNFEFFFLAVIWYVMGFLKEYEGLVLMYKIMARRKIILDR